jgi:hypothetical protein
VRLLPQQPVALRAIKKLYVRRVEAETPVVDCSEQSKETFPMLRDLAVLRTVHRAGIKNVTTQASRETRVQLILSLRRGSRQGYNDANEKSKFLFAYEPYCRTGR